MEKIAVISDIHGNLTALETVLCDIKNKGITRIFCLGDIVGKGAFPKECIDLVLENCEVIVKGNLEEFVAFSEESNNKRLLFYREQLGEEYIDKIKDLDFCHEVYISGSLVRFFHASPTGVYNRINDLDDHNVKIKAFYPSDKTPSQNNADIIVFGDLHTQIMEKFYNKTFINCGSVGNSTNIIRDEKIDSNVMEITQAFYLIIEGEIGSKEYSSNLSFNFVRVPYDIEKELEHSDNLIESEAYKIEITEGTYREINKLKEKYNI